MYYPKIFPKKTGILNSQAGKKSTAFLAERITGLIQDLTLVCEGCAN